MADELEDAKDKLRWAKEHMEILRTQIESFEQQDSHHITVNVNPDAGEYVFHVHDLQPPDPDWGLRIGDCVHNARTALDYLMVRLVALSTGEAPKDIERIQFPIYDAPEKFASATGELRKNLLLRGYLTRVEELQPFNKGNPSIWGLEPHGFPTMSPLPTALERLSLLDNVDKHRTIHIALARISLLQGMGQPIPWPPEFKEITSSICQKKLANETEIARYVFETPLPHEWHPEEGDMKRHLSIHVALDEPWELYGVIEVLATCLWGVEATLGLFEPVFKHRAPALPVTTTLPAPPAKT